MNHLLIILSILLLSSPLFGQPGKPQTIIIPTGSLGEMSEARIKILEKTLESKLDDYFDIVPKELFEEAKDKAFEELDYDECTEDQCIMKIQELLQVENVFKMELILEDGNTQISLTWKNQERKKVEEYYCERCKTKDLRKMIGGLVEKLVGMRKVEPVVVVKKRESGVLFSIKRNGQWQWVKDGDEKKDVKYVGEIENGKPNGQGTVTIGGYKFVGQWKDGDPNGQGTETQSDGSKYEGEWKEGKRSGQGTYTGSKGIKYVGEWKDGRKNGQGTHTFPSGQKYEGEFKEGKRSGQGTYTGSKGIKYVGEWKDGRKNGQ